MGGAIFFSCENGPCNLIIDNALFFANYATKEGGAIKWNNYEPQYINCIFTKNAAGIYGDSIASVANRLVLISPD